MKKLLQYTQAELFNEISKLPGAKKIKSQEYIIIDNQPETVKPMLCVHLDTVDNTPPKAGDIQQKNGILELSPAGKRARRCLGADDRAGVWIILQVLKARPDDFSFAFFCNEEIGCIGSNAYSQEVDTPAVSCFLSIDRKSTDWHRPELADYGYSNNDLRAYLPQNYQDVSGSVTDCSVLSDYTGLACYNFTAGYRYEHTNKEQLNIALMKQVAADIIKLDIPAQIFEADVPEPVFFTDFDAGYDAGTEPEPMLCDYCREHKPLFLDQYGEQVCIDCLNSFK